MSKRGRAANLQGIPPAKRLRANMVDLVMGNELSAVRVRELAEDAGAAGAMEVRDLESAGHRGI